MSAAPEGRALVPGPQSNHIELESRFALEKQVAKFAAKYAIGAVPRPEWWSGFRLKPLEMEFWHDRPFRLHDRLLFSKDQY